MSKNVVVYSSDTCPHCWAAKEFLDSKGIGYEEKNISKNAAYRKELMAKGFMGVPVILVGDETIVGFDKARLEQML